MGQTDLGIFGAGTTKIDAINRDIQAAGTQCPGRHRLMLSPNGVLREKSP